LHQKIKTTAINLHQNPKGDYMPRPSHFPQYSLGEAVVIGKTILEKNGGNPMRRLTLFDILGKSPESSMKFGHFEGYAKPATSGRT
jgi:hypothetical protein